MRTVVDAGVPIGTTAKGPIGAALIRVNVRTGKHVVLNDRKHGNLLAVWNDAGGGNAVPRGREEEHDVEPIPKAGASAIEWRPGGRIQVICAPLALIGPAAFDAAVLQRALALGTVGPGVANLKQVIETAILG